MLPRQAQPAQQHLSTHITRKERPTSARFRVITVSVLAAACLGVVAHAQQATPPPFATTKVDGTDNV